MSELLTCPQGHQWKRNGADGPPTGPADCPVCAAAGAALAPGAAGVPGGTVALPPGSPPAEAAPLPPPDSPAAAGAGPDGVAVPGYELLGELNRSTE
jgi:hypothetical protein